MKKIFGCLLGVLLLQAVLVLSQRSHKRYHLNTNTKETWYRALHHCTAHGMRLATILSREENEQLLKLVRECHRGNDDNFWIGGTKLGNSGRFYWMGHDRPIDFTHYHRQEPNNLKEHEACLELRKQFNFEWNDRSCDRQNYFVCEDRDEHLGGSGGLHDSGSLFGGTHESGLNHGGSQFGGSHIGGSNIGGAHESGLSHGGSQIGGSHVGGTHGSGLNHGGSQIGGTNIGGSHIGGTHSSGLNHGNSQIGDSLLGGTHESGLSHGGSQIAGSHIGGAHGSGLNHGNSQIGGSNIGGSNIGGSQFGGTHGSGLNHGGSQIGGSHVGGLNHDSSYQGGHHYGSDRRKEGNRRKDAEKYLEDSHEEGIHLGGLQVESERDESDLSHDGLQIGGVHSGGDRHQERDKQHESGKRKGPQGKRHHSTSFE